VRVYRSREGMKGGTQPVGESRFWVKRAGSLTTKGYDGARERGNGAI